jgi:hypothetical protein
MVFGLGPLVLGPLVFDLWSLIFGLGLLRVLSQQHLRPKTQERRPKAKVQSPKTEDQSPTTKVQRPRFTIHHSPFTIHR